MTWLQLPFFIAEHTLNKCLLPKPKLSLIAIKLKKRPTPLIINRNMRSKDRKLKK